MSAAPSLPDFIPVEFITGCAALGSVGGFVVWWALRLSVTLRSRLDPLRGAANGAATGGTGAVSFWVLTLLNGLI